MTNDTVISSQHYVDGTTFPHIVESEMQVQELSLSVSPPSLFLHLSLFLPLSLSLSSPPSHSLSSPTFLSLSLSPLPPSLSLFPSFPISSPPSLSLPSSLHARSHDAGCVTYVTRQTGRQTAGGEGHAEGQMLFQTSTMSHWD